MAESLETINKQNRFNNSGLFSNHYLENLIQKAPEWEDDAALPQVYSAIKEIYIKKGKNFENYVEADLEHNWIRPVLDRLGHFYGVQESVHHDPLKPDYAFFPDKSTLDEAYSYKQKKDSNYFYKKSVVVGDAKAWNIALDKSRQGKVLREMANPSFQIDIYLRATPPKWAILTNGRLWRLYHEDTSEKMDCFYEVNLPELIELAERMGDLTPFKYFYLFFRRQAFPEVPLGSSFLDKVREESLSYAQKIGSDLQENVYKAMKILADGFFAEPSNSLSHSEKDIREVQDNSMRLLYRLLFIFYAESRKLLNTDNRRYREMSLKKLKEEISEKLDQGDSPLAVRSTYWEGLRDLFRLINDGSEAFGYGKEEFYIPAYNGGLFDPEKNAFLSTKKIGNSYLAAAIDLLARSEGERGMVFVDYSSLDIRHLGSIYEGILEYRLHLAEEGMAAVKEKGKEVWLAQSQVGARKVTDRVDAGRLYLVTDKGERKATGSFYTPEYIVKHLVKNTLGPLIDKMMEEAMMSSELRRDLLKKLLSLKVLDPAMGSGHFLVEATDYIAREIIHAREIARQEELESEEVAEADIHWARREVVRNCIYGVDLNPMAVELAKLSLWLTTVASNKPLSFLDHHLRCGNSLMGADLERLAVLPGRPAEDTPLWSFGLRSHTEGLLKKYSLMAALPDDSLAMVKWKEDQFRQIKEGELSRRLAELANVWLSTYFGNRVGDDDYYEMQNRINPEKFPDWSGLREQEWFLRAAELAAAKRFFHWELEFPEAFQGERRGFDVVIGNPPYVSIKGQSDEDIKYYHTNFSSAIGRADLAVIFTERSHNLLLTEGLFGFIMTNKFIHSEYGQNLQIELAKNYLLKEIIDYGDSPIFSAASTYACIFITQSKKDVAKNKVMIRAIKAKDALDLSRLTEKRIESSEIMQNQKILIIEQSEMINGHWAEAFAKEKMSLKIISRAPISALKNYSEIIREASASGADDVFIVSKEESKLLNLENDIVFPIVFGEKVKRFEWIEPEDLIIYPYLNGKIIDLEKFEKTKEYLLSQKRFLEDRYCVKKGGKSWLEYHDPSIETVFDGDKIITPDISLSNNFTFFKDKVIFKNTIYVIKLLQPSEMHTMALLALLNSKLLTLIFHDISPYIRGGYFRYKTKFLERLPIRRISFTTPGPDRARQGQELQDLYAAGKHAEILAAVDACLPRDEAGSFIAERERSDVVHDLLAFLAELMLEMNKQKQQEIRGFLGWLEGFVGTRVEDLSPKTRLQGYYEHDYESFLAVLRKNKRKLAVDPARREPAEALQAEFEGSLGKLLPLRERIRQTDELIDAVVYKLYGLTEEEIEIVEGRKGDL